MKFVFLFVLSAVFFSYPVQQLKAQNVAVNTTTPEAALDINGVSLTGRQLRATH